MKRTEVISIIKATSGQALWLADHLNVFEFEEMQRLGFTPSRAVLTCLENSLHAWAG